MEIQPMDLTSIKAVALCMKITGYYPLASVSGKNLMFLANLCAIGEMFVSIAVLITDLFYIWDDLQERAFVIFMTVLVTNGLYKIIYFRFIHKEMLDFVAYVNDNFWYKVYKGRNAEIIKEALRKCDFCILYIAIMCNVTLAMYIITPILGNRKKEEIDRELPFRLHLNVPLGLTPWYQIGFGFDIIAMFYTCTCNFCFDIFMCSINLTLAGEFRILQYDLQRICDISNLVCSIKRQEMDIRGNFIKCIKKHQQLIKCAQRLQELYKNCVVSYIVIFTALICLSMHQFLSTKGINLDFIHCCVNFTNVIVALFLVTVTCNDLSQSSFDVSHAAYNVHWNNIKSENIKKTVMRDLMFSIMRAQTPCQITVGDFSPITLQTFTSICNLAFSFFTLMRQKY